MKIGIFDYYNEKDDFAKIRGGVNLGDNFQTLALENLLENSGINKEDITKVLMTENLLLENIKIFMQGHFGREVSQYALTDNGKVPMFLGFGLLDSQLNEEEEEYLKKYEPILCRDEFTAATLKHYNIEAYISGCMTLTLPRRENILHAKKIFFVDTPEQLDRFVPMNLKSKIHKLSQIISLDNILKNENSTDVIEQEAKKRLKLYKEEAELVVTSRLHVLCPCIAMGIPVIAVRNNFSSRYSFIDKLIPLYTPDIFENINWQPQTIDIENLKKKLFKIAKLMIVGANINKNDLIELDDFYTNRDREIYCKNIKEQLIRLKQYVADDMQYIIWGMGAGGNSVFQCIRETFPQASLVVIVDNNMKNQYANYKVISSEELSDYEDCYIFITTLAGKEEAYKKMKQLNKTKIKDFIFLHENIYNEDLK